MKRTFSVYAIAYIVLLLCVLGVLYAYPKLDLHLLLNSCHTSAQDVFFRYYSTLAEWPLYVVALLPILWKKTRVTGFYALCEVTGGIVVQILKHIFRAPRPVSVFESHPDMVLPVVEGVRLHHHNSFPSGHATTFFIFFTCCALMLSYYYYISRDRQKGLGRRTLFVCASLSLLALAALGGYSRIYLSQHFLSDVCVGSIIGFVTPCLLFYFGKHRILKLEKE
ncbi:MAG: phosphatase PAP2 family protein [Bacteroidaceae bacterium]|nr:phosphatase PAP2 family protein [Bacteroidaceae bacterium]